MNFKDDIKNYQPINEQEIQDQKVIIQLIEQSPHILTRDSSRLSENTEDPRKFNIPWVFSFCQNLRICV